MSSFHALRDLFIFLSFGCWFSIPFVNMPGRAVYIWVNNQFVCSNFISILWTSQGKTLFNESISSEAGFLRINFFFMTFYCNIKCLALNSENTWCIQPLPSACDLTFFQRLMRSPNILMYLKPASINKMIWKFYQQTQFCQIHQKHKGKLRTKQQYCI